MFSTLSPLFERLLVCAGRSGDIAWLRRFFGHRARGANATQSDRDPNGDPAKLSCDVVHTSPDGVSHKKKEETANPGSDQCTLQHGEMPAEH